METPLQTLQLSPTNRHVRRDPDSPTKITSISRTLATCWSDLVADEAMQESVTESSSKMRRGSGGQAVWLDEENNPSPTRSKNRETSPSSEPPAGSPPLCDPRIGMLRSARENVAPMTISPTRAPLPATWSAPSPFAPASPFVRPCDTAAPPWRRGGGPHRSSASSRPSPLAAGTTRSCAGGSGLPTGAVLEDMAC